MLVALNGRAQQRSCVVLSNPVSSQPSEIPAPVYNPLACNSVQNVRVNVHFVQYDDGTGNFRANDDGRPGTPGTITGYDYAQALIWAANGGWNNNCSTSVRVRAMSTSPVDASCLTTAGRAASSSTAAASPSTAR